MCLFSIWKIVLKWGHLSLSSWHRLRFCLFWLTLSQIQMTKRQSPSMQVVLLPRTLIYPSSNQSWSAFLCLQNNVWSSGQNGFQIPNSNFILLFYQLKKMVLDFNTTSNTSGIKIKPILKTIVSKIVLNYLSIIIQKNKVKVNKLRKISELHNSQ